MLRFKVYTCKHVKHMKVKKVKRKMLIEATEKKSENEIKVLIIRMSLRNEMNQIWKNLCLHIYNFFI